MKTVTHIFKYCVVAAVLISFNIAQVQADKFQISKSLYEDFKQYLREIANMADGVFVVTANGMESFYNYCPDSNSCLSVEETLEICREDYHQECIFFAKGKNPEIEFEVIDTLPQLAKNDPIMLRILKEDDLKRIIVGNTISGYYLNKKKWSEYYAPEGVMYAGDGSSNTRYEIKDGKICYKKEGASSDRCGFISRDGDHLKFITEDGKLWGAYVDAWVLPGQQ